jgi:multidrug efflux system membrane fusion protein
MHRSTRIFAIATLAVLAACGKPQGDGKPADGTAVRTATAFTGPASPVITANGLIASNDEMRLSFKTGGILQRIVVREGQTVRKGQLLAQLDLTEIAAQHAQAKEIAAKAERDLERGERLRADEVISLEQLQNLRTQAGVARAARDAAAFNLGLSSIVAPTDGTVLRKLAEERELIPPGQAVIVLGGSARGQIARAGLADREIVQIAPGDPVALRIDAYPDHDFTGRISEIAGAADPRSGLFPIEIKLDASPSSPLSSGMVAKISIVPKAATRGTLTYVPIAALVEGDRDRGAVFVVEGANARKRGVKVAFVSEVGVAIASGIATGERVVTDGALYLVDGERIRVLGAADPK